MTISYSIGPNPKWYIADIFGKPLSAGYMFTYRSLNKSQLKFIFQDPAGNFAWPDPVRFDLNGSQGPFYWQVDSANPNETYYIEVYDVNMVFQWSVDNYLPAGGGGGSIITTGINLSNYITNNVFWRNCGTVSPGSQFTVLAPGNHSALNAFSTEVRFLKNTNTATDSITFLNFPLGTNPLTGDTTPLQYMQYACTNTPAGETQKCLQFPITHGVKNLENNMVTITFWAQGLSGTQNILVQLRQYFGQQGGASPEVITPIQTFSLSNSWVKYTVTTTVPSIAGKVLGACGDDALFIQFQYPLGAACTINFAQPTFTLGSIIPSQTYLTYDQIDSVINSPRSGDTLISYNQTFLTPTYFGYVPANDGGIGSASSGATTRANIDTFPLYEVLWINVSDTYAPVVGGRGASAGADFAANKAMSLTKSLGRVIAGVGTASSGSSTNWALGQTAGEDAHTQTIAEMPSHNHPGSTVPFSNQANSRGAGAADTVTIASPGSVTVASQGGGTPFNVIQPTVHCNVYFKL